MGRKAAHNNHKDSPHNVSGENPSLAQRNRRPWWQWVLIGLFALGVLWLGLRLLFYSGEGLDVSRIWLLLGLALFLFTASVAGIIIALGKMRRRR